MCFGVTIWSSLRCPTCRLEASDEALQSFEHSMELRFTHPLFADITVAWIDFPRCFPSFPLHADWSRIPRQDLRLILPNDVEISTHFKAYVSTMLQHGLGFVVWNESSTPERPHLRFFGGLMTPRCGDDWSFIIVFIPKTVQDRIGAMAGLELTFPDVPVVQEISTHAIDSLVDW